MSYRYMRLLLFYDLPTTTANERKAMHDFRQGLIKEGFYMLQESVYCKFLLNNTVCDSLKTRLNKIIPDAGNIMLLTITEKQFSSMEMLIGSTQKKIIDEDNRLIII